jgi:hypothetical protein
MSIQVQYRSIGIGPICEGDGTKSMAHGKSDAGDLSMHIK